MHIRRRAVILYEAILGIIINVNIGFAMNNLYSNSLLSMNVLVRIETTNFMQYALSKMGSIKCLTFIWDNSLDSTLIESLLHKCPLSEPNCSAYKYQVLLDEGANNTMMESTLSAAYQRQCDGYIIALKRKEKILQILHNGDDFNLINTRARFLIWYRGNDKAFELNKIWTKVTNVIFFHANMKRKNIGVIFTVRELIWPISNYSRRMRVRVIEFWSQSDKRFVYNQNQDWFHDNTNDLRNMTLKILVLEHPPGVIKLRSPDGSVHFGGTEIEIIKVLSTSLNFNYDLQEIDLEQINNETNINYPRLLYSEGNKKIKELEQERNEILQQHLSNETESFFAAASQLVIGDGADIAIGSFFILREYLEYLDMSIPLDVACTSFLTPTPANKPKYLALILPFEYKLWIFVIFVCFFLGPLILRILTSIRSQYKNEYSIFRKQFDVIFTSCSIMSQVPSYTWPKYWPVRWFIGWYWIFWVCLTLAYRASMVAFLTIPLSENPIDNLHELQESGLRLGGWGIELHQLFTKTYPVNETNIDRKKLAEKYEIIKNTDEAISMVAGQRFALYENLRYLQFIKMTRNLSSNGLPSMRLMKQCVVPVHIGLAYQKHSAFTQTINRRIQTFQESGLLIRWRKELISKKKELNIGNDELFKIESGVGDTNEEDQIESSEQRALNIHDLQGCFYILFLGVLLSSAIFIGEWIFHRCWPSKALLSTTTKDAHVRLKTRLSQLKLILLVEDDIYKEFTKLGERKRNVGRNVRKERKCPIQRKLSTLPFQYIE